MIHCSLQLCDVAADGVVLDDGFFHVGDDSGTMVNDIYDHNNLLCNDGYVIDMLGSYLRTSFPCLVPIPFLNVDPCTVPDYASRFNSNTDPSHVPGSVPSPVPSPNSDPSLVPSSFPGFAHATPFFAPTSTTSDLFDHAALVFFH